MAKKSIPEINASSMADIAFLLLTFFLVATSITTDKGLITKIPPFNPQKQKVEVDIKRRNVYEIMVNRDGKLLLRGEEYLQGNNIKDLRKKLKNFIVNNYEGSCKDCYYTDVETGARTIGQRSADMSESPSKAVIVLQSKRNTPYGMYLAVYNEIKGAFNDLRDDYANRHYKRSYEEITDDKIRAEIYAIFPETIVEKEIK